MATKPTAVENIQVLQVGKYGVRVDEKTWFGVNEPLTPSHFVPNEGYKVAVVVSKTGKKYINEILGQEVTQAASAPAAAPTSAPAATAAPATSKAEAPKPAPATTTATKNPTRSGFGQPLTDYDLQIQRQISRAGVVQAALMSPALAQWAVNIDEYLALVRKAADFGFKYVSE
jgi:ribosomal protein L12E/L44/L45/RPP1/RPP2